MSRVLEIKKLTDRRFINLYEARYADKSGAEKTWTYASRQPSLVADGPRARAEAVVIVPTWVGAEGRRLVMIKEFRVPIGGVEYGFPAGLVETGEPYVETARRELLEETGLVLTRVTRQSPPLYASAGMVDEAAVMIFAECTGSPSTAGAEASEDIEILLLDHGEVSRLCRDEEIRLSAKAWPVLCLYEGLGRI